MFGLRVPRERAEEAQRALRRLRLLDGGRRAIRDDGFVVFPLRGVGGRTQGLPWGHVLPYELPPAFPRPPADRVLGLLRDVLPQEQLPLVPRRWKRIGGVVMLRVPRELRAHEEEVARAFAQVLRVSAVVAAEGGVEGAFRTPRVRLLLGSSTETVHREDGVMYRLDAAKIMFAAGNKAERARMGRSVRPGEVVVDMFAGIGYFSLPMALHSSPSAIHSCEVNPEAYGYLEENLALNHVRNVSPLLGDCREVAPEGIAHRVVMGYLWTEASHLERGLGALGKQGILHYHALASRRDPEKPWREVSGAAANIGRHVGLLEQRVVKSFAPGVDHVVLDVAVG